MKENLIINRGGDQKWIILVSKQGLREGEEDEGEEEEERGETKSKVWILVYMTLV